MKYKKITQQQRVNYQPARLKPQAKYVFNSSRSLPSLIGKTPGKFRGTQPNLPFKVVGYDFSVENGLRLKPRSNFWLRSTFIITMLLTTLPLLWWLNSSNASIPNTVSANTKQLSFPIYTTPVAHIASATPIANNSAKLLPTSLTPPVSLKQPQAINQLTSFRQPQAIIYSKPLLRQPTRSLA